MHRAWPCWYVTMTSPQDATDVTGQTGIQDSGKVNTCTRTYVQVERSTNNCSQLDQLINIVRYWFITWSVYLNYFSSTTMTIGTIDYAAYYLKYKTPTPIQGTPTNKSLKRLKQELWANASSVESDLRGGDHGYLGLVLTDAEYTEVSRTAFTAPTFPEPLTIPPGTDQVTALNLREVHQDKNVLTTNANMLKNHFNNMYKMQ